MNSKNTPNATFSPELQGGNSPCRLQVGQQIDLFGQEVPLANHSARPANKKGKATNATFSLCGSASLASASLQQSLENKLQQQLPMGGLTMFIKGWKRKVTPLGRQYCQLAVLVRPIDVSAYGLWPTPQAMDGVKACNRYREGRQNGVGAMVSLWATPTSRDWKNTGDLNNYIKGRNGKGRNDQLSTNVFGMEMENGLPAQMEKCASLSLEFPCWLMGFSTAALSSMRLAMLLYRKSRRSS